ncbi:MAG TPA: type II toxin-antitoxin system RelE/ParE family toxin [Burkholderiaceae bacterium]|nr:type II toxin-antitoxin system RelE/ParE family toxin [Burkholderiaceae bacterium]
MTASKAWRVRLAAAAETDFRNIVLWTSDNFGARQARTYSVTLSIALRALTKGPLESGATPRDDIGRGIYTLHAARHGRKVRHFVVFRVGRDIHGDVIDVLRLLHDAMDLPQHIPPESECT